MERPGIGELWHGTIAVAHRHFTTFAVIAGVTVLLPGLLSRLLFPELLLMPVLPAEGAPAPALPAGYWPYLIVIMLAYVLGTFSIAAVSADPNEGGGRTMGAIVQSALPAIGKAILAGLLFGLAYLVFAVVLGIGFGILAVIIAAANGGAMSNASAGTAGVGLAIAMMLVLFPTMLWVGARLSPLTGVYLVEDAGVVAGIKRAWALSRGSAGVLFGIALIVGLLTVLPAAAQLGLLAAGLTKGLAGFVAGAAVAALGALIFVYQATGIGFVYRRLRAVEGS